jgi:hypothetical protein
VDESSEAGDVRLSLKANEQPNQRLSATAASLQRASFWIELTSFWFEEEGNKPG